MNEQRSSRFKDAPWFPKSYTTTIIGGAGGIGSWLAVLLTRAGFHPAVYDFDSFEDHNMGGQFVTRNFIGQPKVVALRSLVADFTGISLNTFNQPYDQSSMADNFMFSGFDNMQARKVMFEKWKLLVVEWQKTMQSKEPYGEHNPYSFTPIFIDGRLLMEQLQIFCVTPDKIEEYEKHLFDDKEVDDGPCTLKQTSHSASMIASFMTGFFTNHITNCIEKDNSRAVPFFWEYFIPINYLNVT
jgi:hypothetical protein